MLPIYIGTDTHEEDVASVCQHSILRRASMYVEFHRLRHYEMRARGIFRRPWEISPTTGEMRDAIDGTHLTPETAHYAYYVPLLQDYKGWALYVDGRVVMMDNVRNLYGLRDDKYAVMVARPKRGSCHGVILFNCEHPANKALRAEYLNRCALSELRNLDWCKRAEIGELPIDHSWTEGVSPLVSKPLSVHYIKGGPWCDEWDVAFADQWSDAYERWRDEADGAAMPEGPVNRFSLNLSASI